MDGVESTIWVGKSGYRRLCGGIDGEIYVCVCTVVQANCELVQCDLQLRLCCWGPMGLACVAVPYTGYIGNCSLAGQTRLLALFDRGGAVSGNSPDGFRYSGYKTPMGRPQRRGTKQASRIARCTERTRSTESEGWRWGGSARVRARE